MITILLLLSSSILVYAYERLIFSQPDALAALYGPTGIPERHLSQAMFGIPSYSHDLTGQVFYASPGDACSAITPDPNWNNAPGHALILLADRGNCTFVTKVRNAQIAGAMALIVADFLNYDTTPPFYRPPLMADDGTGRNLQIPSILVVKSDADAMKQFLNQGVYVSLAWDLPNPDGTVEWDLWTSAIEANDQSKAFKNTFGRVARALGAASLFTPHYFIVDGRSIGCSGKTTCTQCTNTGRYCNKESVVVGGLTGKDVVQENLRQICVFQWANKTGQPYLWFDYVSRFDAYCNRTVATFTLDCSHTVMQQVGVNPTEVDACVSASGGSAVDGGANTLLDASLQSISFYSIWWCPTLLINQVIYYGSSQCPLLPDGAIDVNHCGVLDAICSGLVDISRVAACNTDPGCDIGKQRDECGGCSGDNGLMKDACGQCIEPKSPSFNMSCAGCDGVPNSGKRLDICGNCVTPGVPGPLVKDACGQCIAPTSENFNKSCAGCDGVPNSGKRLDACGVCGGTSTKENCQTSSSGISITTVVLIGVVSLVVVGLGVFFYMRRQKNKMKLDIDKLLQQYLPLEQANNMRNASNNGHTNNPDEERLVSGTTDSSAS